MSGLDFSKQKTRLIFESGKFVLSYPGTRTREVSKNEYWVCRSLHFYETTSLREAALFRNYSDETAEKIFRRMFQTHYTLPELPPLPFLDSHQQKGVEWILSRKRSYLAHAPGAGKTATAIIASCLAEGLGQTVFIVPPTLTVNWEKEIWKFTEYLGVFPTIGVVRDTAHQEDVAWRADFLIVPDSMLAKPWVYTELSRIKKKLIAVDEASRFKESNALRSIAFYGGSDEGHLYPGLYHQARHVVFLDGSPMPNRPMELWAPTYALHPEAIDCMSQDDFGYRYCGPQITDRGQYTFLHSTKKHEAELKNRLQKDFMHVVAEDKLSHPERLRSLLFMNEDVRTPEQKNWERTHLKNLNLEKLNEKNSQGELAHFRRELGMRKIPWIASYTRDRLIEKNESILLFAWHRVVCEGLAQRLESFRPGLIIGGVSEKVREKEFELFQSGKKKLLILNIAAGGRGHNLQRADRLLFGEYSYSDETNKQCEKRASRRGRNEEDFVRCDYIVCPESMDEKILNSVFTKESRVKRIIG